MSRWIRLPTKTRTEAMDGLDETRLRIEAIKKKIAELEYERNAWLRDAWDAGERNVTALARHTGLSTHAVTRQLQGWGIDVKADKVDDPDELRLARALVAFSKAVDHTPAWVPSTGVGVSMRTHLDFLSLRVQASAPVRGLGMTCERLVETAQQILATPIPHEQDARALRPLLEEIKASLQPYTAPADPE